MGPILRWMDIAACLSAEKLALTCCVTLSMDHLLFDSSLPIELGTTILVEAQVQIRRFTVFSPLSTQSACRAFVPPSPTPQVVRAFGTSAEVVVRVYRDPSLQPYHCSSEGHSVCFASAFFVFVCRKIINAQGKEVRPPFPHMFPETQWEMNECGTASSIQTARSRNRRRYELSTLRRKARMEKKAMMAEMQLQQRHLQEQQHSGYVVVKKAESTAAAPALPDIPAAASRVQLLHIVMPPHANHMNT